MLKVAAELSHQVHSVSLSLALQDLVFFSARTLPTLLLMLPLGTYDHDLLKIFISLQESVPKSPFSFFFFFGRMSSPFEDWSHKGQINPEVSPSASFQQLAFLFPVAPPF